MRDQDLVALWLTHESPDRYVGVVNSRSSHPGNEV